MSRSQLNSTSSEHDQQSEVPVLVVEQGEVSTRVIPITEGIAELQRQLLETNAAVTLRVIRFGQWEYKSRIDFINLLAALTGQVAIRVAVNDAPQCHVDCFEAVLAALEASESVEERQNTRAVATYAAVTFHGNALGDASSLVADRLKAIGFKGERAGTVLKMARQLANTMRAEAGEDVLVTAPNGEQLVVPEGWLLDAAGVHRLMAEDVIDVASCPVIVAGRLQHIDTGTEHLKIAWRRNGNWKDRVVLRSVVAAARTIVALADYGCPVTSNGAPTLVQYIADFEAANYAHLPLQKVSEHFGWQGDNGSAGFLWGSQAIGGDHADNIEPATGDETTSVIFQGTDAGNDELQDGFCAGGSLDGWIATIATVAHLPQIMINLYVSLAAPLILVLRARNVAIDNAGETSGGKTITLRVAGSVWGNPDETQRGSVVSKWDATRVGIERRSAAYHNMPIILDDTKLARKRDDVAQTLYDMSSGCGRTRGSQRGLAATGNWQTVLISSGEAPITSFSQDGGTRARTLQLWGSPFQASSTEVASVANAVNQGVMTHFGHAGPAFVEYLMANRQRWSEWQTQHRELTQSYMDRGNDAVAARRSEHLATVSIAAQIAHEALNLPWEFADPVDALWNELMTSTTEARPAARALLHAANWATANADRFYRMKPGSGPSAGWVGKLISPTDGTGRDDVAQHNWCSIGFIEFQLKQILADEGFTDYVAITKAWFDNGWLQANSGRHKLRTRIGADNVYVIAITREAIDQAAELSSEHAA